MKVVDLIVLLSRIDNGQADVKILESSGTTHIDKVLYWSSSNTVVIST